MAQEIQQRFNILVENKRLGQKQNSALYKFNNIELFNKTNDSNLPLMEVRPEILDGIKMTTTEADIATGIYKKY